MEHISVVEIFSVGIGPSSSHTVGPMRASKLFIEKHTVSQIEQIVRIKSELFGALGFTGVGHGTDKAILMGLERNTPEKIDPQMLESRFQEIVKEGCLFLEGGKRIQFSRKTDMVFHRKQVIKKHSNGMRFTSFDSAGNVIHTAEYYSVGGGFVWDGKGGGLSSSSVLERPLKYPFSTGSELLEMCEESGLSIPAIMVENEKSWRSPSETRDYLLEIWRVMDSCIQAGFQQEGILPGGINLRRRAPNLYKKLKLASRQRADPLIIVDWVNLYALSVCEVNAAGGKVVTAPTNGAAGIIPAVLAYYRRFREDTSDDGIFRFLLTAAAIGILYKKNASISGAEVGCQGEVGVACSMAAGALTDALGGTPAQVENAAEIGIEHNLGLTCDPIGGLVQIPCIERNAMGAVKAINASRLAMLGDGQHKVHLDKAIETMRQTGLDMKTKYKETSRGGLAVNVIEC